MRIVFMGTPEFAVPCLEMLLSESQKYQVVCVVTKPDMPKGRKLQLTPPPIKDVAVKAGIPVLQPQNVKTQEFYEELVSFKPDLFVTVAYACKGMHKCTCKPSAEIQRRCAALACSYKR